MAQYTTRSGDMWDGIAYRELGSTAFTGALMGANPAYKDYFIFPSGVVLTLPEVESTAAETLPPWKRTR